MKFWVSKLQLIERDENLQKLDRRMNRLLLGFKPSRPILQRKLTIINYINYNYRLIFQEEP